VPRNKFFRQPAARAWAAVLLKQDGFRARAVSGIKKGKRALVNGGSLPAAQVRPNQEKVSK
jgi:hypothetical protein